MQIPIDVKVLYKDGSAAGHTAAIILDPKTQQVTHVVVRGAGSLIGEYLVPVAEIDKSTQHEITLHWNQAELAAAPRFDKVVAAGTNDGVPAEGSLGQAALYWPYGGADLLGVDPLDGAMMAAAPAYFQVEQAPGDEIAVHTGAHVEATNGGVGKVDEFLIDRKSGTVTHLVLRHGHLWGKREIRVPVHAIDHIQDDTVYLKLDKAAIEDLPDQPKDA